MAVYFYALANKTTMRVTKINWGYVTNEKGKNGNCYDAFAGFCLETQHFPDALNQEHFPSIVLNPEEKFESKTTYKLLTNHY